MLDFAGNLPVGQILVLDGEQPLTMACGPDLPANPLAAQKHLEIE